MIWKYKKCVLQVDEDSHEENQNKSDLRGHHKHQRNYILAILRFQGISSVLGA